MNEQVRAERCSAAVDLLLHDSEALSGSWDATDTDLLHTARRFARLPELLGQVDPAFERQILRRSRARVADSGHRSRRRLFLAASAMLAAILLAIALTPLGQSAVASLRAVFHLGSTEVQIEPGLTPSLPTSAAVGGAAIRESFTLAQAQQRASFPIAQPQQLPPGYQLQEVLSYTYPELPAWVPQPIFVELVYADHRGEKVLLRVYSIPLGEEATISGLNLQAEDIQSVRDVEVSGRPGVLLTFGGSRSALALHEVVWEQDERILALSSQYLTQEDLLRIAESVR